MVCWPNQYESAGNGTYNIIQAVIQIKKLLYEVIVQAVP